jgi:adenine-specific DNA-methyltransferase
MHNDDEDMTREPEMVQAYRDTWELGLHSYLTYLRDRLLLARELLSPSGSVFVQISDENLHHVRELLDEIFGQENFCAQVTFQKKTMPLGSDYFEQVSDYLVWFSRNKDALKSRPLFKAMNVEGNPLWNRVELPGGERIKLTTEQVRDHRLLPIGARVFRLVSLLPAQYRKNQDFVFRFEGKDYPPPGNSCWKTDRDGMEVLAKTRRLEPSGASLQYVLFLDDYAQSRLTALWADVGGASDKTYTVQTSSTVVQRCLLASTDPGDLVLDPTCGSGTTAYVAEQWGRRWITIDTSRVPLALARQRLLTATFPWYELVDESRGPAGGFVYKRKQNRKGEEVGGIVPHVTLKSIANNEPADEEILVDRPEEDNKTVRVTGPFCVEATIPTAADLEGMNEHPEAENVQAAHEETAESFTDRMLEILRRSPRLRLPGNRTVDLTNIRKPAKSLSLQAEALVAATAEGQEATITDAAQEALEQSGELLGGLSKRPVAFIFGPENGAVSERLVYEAAREARAKNYTHLYVIGFAIHPNARQLVENAEQMIGIRATYVQMTPDVLMGDLLKNMRSSQIFSVCGLPEVELRLRADGKYEVELLGLDVFDPATMESSHEKGDDVPAWLLDTDYNGLCFHVSQAFFPRTSAWEGLKKALKADYEATVWDHLAGTVSTPFEPNGNGEIAVKVIDDRGNELMVTRKVAEAKRAK